MYHLLVDPDSNSNAIIAKTVKRSSDRKEDMEYWFNRILKFDPDSITLWDGPILLNYHVNTKEQR